MFRPVNKSIICGTLLTVLLSPLCMASSAVLPRYEVATRVVNFADLDLNNSRGVATLYKRIKSAADQVCEPADSVSFDTLTRLRRCKQQAIVKAVEDVNSPALTSLHMATTNLMDLAQAQ